VRIAEQHELDVVLTDVRMPKVDGLQALTAIKALNPFVRVILMTAFVGPDLLKRAEEEGSLRLLRKPANIAALLEIASNALWQSRSVLFVDDDADQLSEMTAEFAEHAMPVFPCERLEDALEMLGSAPKVVLLNVTLDHLDSRVNMLAITDVNPTTLLILYSGNSADNLHAAPAASRGMVHAAFTKPVPIEKLLASLVN
jgi:DNA-binding NtrC family response regulator